VTNPIGGWPAGEAGYTSDVKRMDRRQAFGIWGAGLMSVASACGERGATVIRTPEGPVLQLEREDFLVLVSGFQEVYRPGDRVLLKVIVNNQSRRFATARIRTRLLGRGQQAVAEAEVASVNVKPVDASAIERSLSLPNNLAAGEYTLSVELPPWSFEGRQTGGGALNTTIKVQG
jgi:hypothetical protein